MMKLNFKDQILPHVVAIITFLLVCLIFYWPVFFEGKEIYQNDVFQGIAGGKEISDYRIKTGEEALWTNSMFGGMPAYLINIAFSGEWLTAQIHTLLTLKLPNPAHLTFMSMLGFYFLLLAFKVRPWLAITGAIAYGFSSFNLISIEAGHNWKVGAMAIMPMVLGAIHLLLSGKKYWGFVLTIIAVGLQIKMNHIQITYYLFLLLLVYGAFQLFFAAKENRLPDFLKSTALLLLAGAIGVGLNAGRLWTSIEYSKYSIRGESELSKPLSDTQGASGLDKEYAFNWSLGKMESLTFIVPNFFGGASGEALDEKSNLYEAMIRQGVSQQQTLDEISRARTYWGDQPFTSGPVYLGAIICFLFILSILVLEPKHRNWILAGTLLSLLLAWGKNLEWFNYFMFDYFPAYNKFRAVSMAVVVAMMVIPLGGFMALEKLLQASNPLQFTKVFIRAAIISLGLIVLMIIASVVIFDFEGPIDGAMLENGYPDWFVNALREDRGAMLRADAFRSFILIALSAALIFLSFKEMISKTVFATGLFLLMIFDLGGVGVRYLNSDNFGKSVRRDVFAATEADLRIKSDPRISRVISVRNPWADARPSIFHQSIGGYHGAKMRRYQDLIESHLQTEHEGFINALNARSMDFPPMPVLNMLNTRYLILGDQKEAVLENDDAMGNAWLVSSIAPVNNADEELASLAYIPLDSIAVIDQTKFSGLKSSYNANGSIALLNYAPNKLDYEVESEGDAFAVFSEMYYPAGWKAFIDGNEAPIIRANYALRALEIPSGKHQITFKFEPKSYFLGNKISSYLGILVVVFIVFGLVMEFRPKKDLAQ